jgi:8-oxo-dGTP pyrophosphatase MutT (NUDIX family)
MILPITIDNEVVFVKQYKHGIGEICIELPAGRIENGKTPSQTAIQELKEETGIITTEDQLQVLTELWTEPSKSAVHVHGFLVRDVSVTKPQQLEKTELIELVKIPLTELASFIQDGNIHASDTLALLLCAQLQFPELFLS